MKTYYTINAVQAQILALLKERQPLTIAQLQSMAGGVKTAIQNAQFDLRLRLFVTAEKTGQHRTIQLEITAAGEIALDAYRKKCDVAARHTVTPTRINLMKQPVWQPPAPGYFRNGGNWHIPSLGATS